MSLKQSFFEERAALEAKYEELYKLLYAKRYKIVSGKINVGGIKNDAAQVKGVPDFRLIAMLSNKTLAEKIYEPDIEALKFFKDIKYCKIDKPHGFKLEFLFDPNPYFSNSFLTKTFHMLYDEEEPLLEKAIGMEINWFPNKCLTHKILETKSLKGSNNVRKFKSFFTFFNLPMVSKDEDIDIYTAKNLFNQMQEDYDIGLTFKDNIIPEAVSWFTGEADQAPSVENRANLIRTKVELKLESIGIINVQPPNVFETL